MSTGSISAVVNQVLPSWRGEHEGELVSACRSVTGIDYDLPSLQHHRSVRRLVRGDISALRLADGSFDFVTYPAGAIP